MKRCGRGSRGRVSGRWPGLGVDRKTGKRYVAAAVAAGLVRDGGEGQLADELIGQVVSVVRPVRPDGHGRGWAGLETNREQIVKWVGGDVPVVKIGILLARQGVVVAERTLHRFAAERCGGGPLTAPVEVAGQPGGELGIEFGDLGLIPAGDGRRRKLRALVFTACFSRYMFVYLTFSMTLEEVIAGCEEAWAVLLRGIPGRRPGQHEPGHRQGGRGEPAADPRMAGVLPGAGFRHRPGPGPSSPG